MVCVVTVTQSYSRLLYAFGDLFTPLAKEATMAAIPRPSVRAATVHDAANLAAIHVRSWKAAYQGLLPQDYLDMICLSYGAERWLRNLQASDWPKAGVVVAVPGPELVGFVGFGPTRDEGEDAGLVGEIRAIYVIPEAWGKGLGKRLMASALGRLAVAGYAQATLWVLDTNARARGFYEKGGWAQDGAARCGGRSDFPMREVRYRKDL
jgi:ribosomal protein S18 acetylase RimI-like enzyme